jgi:NADH dehydrogenase FAD-containing subunit
MKTDVLVIGGGAAGLAAASRLRRIVPDAEVTVVDANPDNVYRPWLIHRPTGRLASDDLRLPLTAVASRVGFGFQNAKIAGLDLEKGVAATGDSSISFGSVLVACGAPADTARIAGAADHALFPCDVADAEKFAAACRRADGPITIVVSGERIGPGLEYAAYLAAGTEGGAGRRVQLVADAGVLAEQFGAGPSGHIERLLRRRGVDVVTGRKVTRVTATHIEFTDGPALESALTAVVGPLRGPLLGLPGTTLTAGGFLEVDDHLRNPRHRNLFGAGDAIARHDWGWLPSWRLAKLTGTVAAGNIAAELNGGPLSAFSPERGRKLSRSRLPDLGGTAVLAVNGRVLASGRWVRALRRRADKAHFQAYAPAEENPRRYP